ncbi:MAG: hypothetical protein GY765_38845 [bacterium]|nr:hypothetical protein [bacterium]
MKTLLKGVCICVIICAFVFSAHAGEADIKKQERDFLQAYDQLYAVALKFQVSITNLEPPKGIVYTAADLKEYNSLLNALFEKKPKYKILAAEDVDNDAASKEVAKLLGKSKTELGVYKKAEHLAKITGLPHRELAVYQKGKGVYGLKKLLYSVKNLKNLQWVYWYLVLDDNGDSTSEKSLFMPDVKEPADLVALRLEYGDRAKAFNNARNALNKQLTLTLKNTQNITAKNKFGVKLFLYKYIGKKAGRVGWLSENRAGYPLQNIKTKHYPKAVSLAKKLGVEFSDLAYLKRKIGNYGLKKMLKEMIWLEDVPGLIREVFKK